MVLPSVWFAMLNKKESNKIKQYNTMRKTFTFMVLLLAALLPASVGAQNCNITLPWSQNFEGLATGADAFVPCWTRVDSCISGSAVYPNVYSYGSTHGNVLNFMGNGMTSSGTMRAATPCIPAPLNSLELSFVVYKNTLNLYLATNPADQSTYVLVGSYAPGYSWTTYEVRTNTIAGAPADTGYLVFTCPFGSGYSNGNPYLDDLYVTELNPCERPSELVADRVGVNSALLAWPEVQGAWSYNVSYSTNANMTNATVVVAPTASITLTGLDANTHYYVQVTTVCGENSESDPRATEFTTQLSCYSITNLRQVAVNHESAAFQWDYDMRGNDADAVVTYLRDLDDPSAGDYEEMSYGPNYHFFSGLDFTHRYLALFRTICGADTAEAVSIPIRFPNCGETALSPDSTQWSNDHPVVTFYNYSYSQMMYPASALYDMDSIRGIALRRHVRSQSVATSRTMSIWLGTAPATTTTFGSPMSVNSMTQVANNVNYILLNQEWDTLLFTTPFEYDGTSNIIVTIVDNTGSNTSMGATPYWLWHESDWPMHYKFNDDNPYSAATPPSVSHKNHLPDLRFVGLCDVDEFCEAPVMAVVAVDSVTADIEWLATGSAVSWNVQYRTMGGGSWTTVTGITSAPYTLTGLTPDTRYEVRIGVDCGGQVRYGSAVPFLTQCAIQHIPFHFEQSDLDAVIGPGFTSCWSFSRYILRGHLSLSHRAYLCNIDYNQWIMLPAVAEHLSGARLRTWAAVSSPSMVRVGVASQSDCSDVVWVDTIDLPGTDPNTDTNKYITYFDNYEGDGNRIVLSPIVDNEYSFVYFFDFHIEYAEGCRPVVGMTLDSADANSLSFHWTPVGTGAQWLVYVDGVEHGLATSPNYTVTGLNPYTRYDITVRTFCGEGDTSFARTATFLTGCEGESCLFTVNAVSLLDTGWAGGFLEIVSGNIEVGTVRMNSGRSVSNTFMVCADMPLSFNWYSGNADSICAFTILNEVGDTLYICNNASTIDSTFLTIDSICSFGGGDEPGPGPNPGGIDGVSGAKVTLSPNPAKGMVTVNGIEAGAEVSLVDLNGREVLAVKPSGKQSVAIDLHGLSRGAYFVRVVGEKTTVIKKLIVQ